MLDSFRKAAKSKLALIPVFGLIASFSVWGTQGIFRGRTPTALAKVGSHEIGPNEFAHQFALAVDRIREQSPGFTEAQARAFGIDRQVLARMIGEMALNEEAQRLRLGVADEVVRANIRSQGAFHNAQGQFDQKIYDYILRRNHLLPEVFEDQVRGELMRGQLVSAVAPVAEAPKGLAGLLYAFDHEERRVTLLSLPASLAGEPDEPDEAALEAFHQANAPLFSRPERRALSFVRIAARDFLDEVAVSDADIEKAYEDNKERYTTPERRALDQLLFPSREDADAAAADIAKGSTFEAVAETAKAKGVELIDLGDVAKTGIIDPSVADAAFALAAPGAVSAVVPGEFGFVLVRLRKIEPASTRPLAEVKDELRERLALDPANELSFKTLEAFEDKRLEGQSLEAAAEATGLKVETLPAVDRQGKTADGAKPEALPADPVVLATAFDAIEGEESDPLALADGSSLVLRLDDVEEGGLKPLDEVRDEVKEAWRAAEKKKRVADFVESLLAETKSGKTLEGIAAAHGASATARREPVSRDTDDATVPAALAHAIFAGRAGEVVSAPARSGEGFVLARIDEVVRPDLAKASAEIEADAERISQTMRAELIDRYVAALREKAGVVTHEDRIAKALGASGDT
ncbi:MAG: peptidyl-prolyl cis-trans isomerase [Alphaproteobacteria bacterium]|nr:peptidyl-prolyl cis-trans isomerase [Alphaproteobacteria bacterium]